MQKVLIRFLLILIPCSLIAQDFIPIWPDQKMPNSKGMQLERIENNEWITQISTPDIYTFFPSKEEKNYSAVLILPSGGYHHLTYILDGTQLAKRFNTFGVYVFVLIYRLPTSPDLLERNIRPLQDAQLAMRIMRANAVKWNIDPEKIGVMGAASGGHLASTLGTHIVDVSSTDDSFDQYPFAPKFMILISPVISMGKYTPRGSLNNLLGENPSQEMMKHYSNELQVNENTCPTFIVHAADDYAVNPMNSILSYQALLKLDISASLHIFPKGDHKIGLINNPGSTDLWPELCKLWLKEIGII